MNFKQINAVVMDMDGVLWLGDQPLPGMQELFEWLQESNTPYALATNNAGKTQADYVAKLARMGVHNVSESHIVTSATATAAYLQERYPAGTPVFVVGMQGLQTVLDESGFDITSDGQPEVVVVGVDFTLTYEKLRMATLYIRNGAAFVGTNPDKTFPSPDGLVPGAGSIIAAIEAATDQTPTVIGKPERHMFDAALKTLGSSPDQTLMIGDRLGTDIVGAKRVGMKTALLFTGVSTPEDLSAADNDVWSDVAYEGLPELIKAWAGDVWYREKIKAKRAQS
jgi:4-nitrophenyl phosphatase